VSKKIEKNLIVGLDIGTSKVVAIVGEVTPDGEIDVIGIGSHPSRGLKKGVVVNIEYSQSQFTRHCCDSRQRSNSSGCGTRDRCGACGSNSR
jgi:hypothetical protein